LQRHPEAQLGGVMTHFACADSGQTESIAAQLERFDLAAKKLAELGFHAPLRHSANSAALLCNRGSHLDMARPGIALFGIEPYSGAAPELRPVMRLRSEIVALRQLQAGQTVGYGATWTAQRASQIATVPVGYADGLSRGLSNRGHVLVRGRRAPIVGVVSMDMTMIDVTDIDGARLGDECVALGPQKGPLGEDVISANEIAAHLGTIPWEVLTNVSRRVPRFYREP
jgi:alanine racemase